MKQIYLHGLGQTSVSWEKTILQLNSAETSVCLDLAEMLHGEEVVYENLYKEFSSFCDEFDDKIDLCGLSLGGVLALNYAIEHPEKINSLVLIAAQYKMPKRLLQIQNILFKFMPKSVFQETGFKKKEFIQLCKSMIKLDFSSSVNKITCPSLIVLGEKDRANKKAAMRLTNILKNARLQIINASGHEVNIEAPEKLADVLRNFYSNTAL